MADSPACPSAAPGRSGSARTRKPPPSRRSAASAPVAPGGDRCPRAAGAAATQPEGCDADEPEVDQLVVDRLAARVHAAASTP